MDLICFITQCLVNDLIEATCGDEAPDGNNLCPDIGAVAGDWWRIILGSKTSAIFAIFWADADAAS